MNRQIESAPAPQVSRAGKHRLLPFGPNGLLHGFTTQATAPSKGIGAVLWGTGIAHLRVARRLARLGVPVLQTELANRRTPEGHYSRMGIALCRAAMDKLAAEQDVDSFILMANCAFANISLNTAIVDPRVRVLMLTNPFLTERQKEGIERWSLAKKLLNAEKWRRLLIGNIDLRTNLDRLYVLLTGRPRRNSAMRVGYSPTSGIGKEMTLQVDLDEALRELCGRGTEIYFACSSTELGLRYLRRYHGAAIEELEQRGSLTLGTLDTDVHYMDSDHEGVVLHSDAMLRWLDSTNVLERVAAARAGGSPAER